MSEEWTSDGDHPSIEGYRRLGERVSPALNRHDGRLSASTWPNWTPKSHPSIE
jgi:hypothetical protein